MSLIKLINTIAFKMIEFLISYNKEKKKKKIIFYLKGHEKKRVYLLYLLF